jgi:hypothetical protein
MCTDELEQQLDDDRRKYYFNYEKQSGELYYGYLFDRLWYMDTCKTIKHLSTDMIERFVEQKAQWNEYLNQLMTVISQLVIKKEFNVSEVGFDIE